jgi:hypothetical protein
MKLVNTYLNLGRDILNTCMIIMNIRDYIGHTEKSVEQKNEDISYD